jgi:hypothetical protein
LDTKPVSEFFRRGDGYRGRCKSCTPKGKRWLADKPTDFARDYQRNSNLKIKFGITNQQYDEMWAAQQGLCAICKQPERFIHPKTGVSARLAVDHDATTGKIRGLLCACCNRGIGFLQHDVLILGKAIEYLNGHNQRQTISVGRAL